MNLNTLITLFYHPLSILIIGSVVGLLFRSFIWLPYKIKIKEHNKKNRYKKEVFLRISELKAGFENQYSTKIIASLLEGKTTINPDFRNWKLDALIYSGWPEQVFQNSKKTLRELENLLEESDTSIGKEKIKKGLLVVNNLTTDLKKLRGN